MGVSTADLFLYTRDQYTVAQQTAISVDRHSLTSCVWIIFPDGFPHYAWTAYSAHSDYIGPRVYLCLAVACHPHLWQNDQFFNMIYSVVV